jgi:hypothetical protein
MRKSFLTLLIVIMFGCQPEQETPQYSLKISSNPTTGGTIVPSSGQYYEGEIVEIKAEANTDYVFHSWSGSVSGSSNTISVEMNSDKDIEANFYNEKYDLTLDVFGEGEVTSKLIVPDSFSTDVIVELTATPTGDWEFVEWSGDITSTENPVEVNFDSPKNITAKFTRNFDYNQSWDVIRHINDIVTVFNNLDYYSDCGFDTTNAMADFNSDGYIDILLAPQCSDEVDARQPPIAIFLNDGNGNFKISEITIENNIGVLSGTNSTLVGDFNNDDIPDVFFASHNGHGGPGGFPSILLSSSDKFIFKDILTELGWYGAAASSDFDLDGDLDVFISGNKFFLLTNENGSWIPTKEILNNLPANITNINRFSFIDMNSDGLDDIVFSDGPTSIKLIYRTQDGYDYQESIVIPYPTFDDVEMQIEDKVFYDLDENGYLDVITWSYPASPEDGSFTLLQAVFNYGDTFEDQTSEVFPNFVNYNRGNYDWLRFYDLNINGKVELFENRIVENWLHLEWNGSSFEAVD